MQEVKLVPSWTHRKNKVDIHKRMLDFVFINISIYNNKSRSDAQKMPHRLKATSDGTSFWSSHQYQLVDKMKQCSCHITHGI